MVLLCHVMSQVTVVQGFCLYGRDSLMVNHTHGKFGGNRHFVSVYVFSLLHRLTRPRDQRVG